MGCVTGSEGCELRRNDRAMMWRTVSCAIAKLVSKLADQGGEAVSARPSVSKVVRKSQSICTYVHIAPLFVVR